MKFYYIYKSLAHPENNGYIAPYSLEERLLHVAEAKRQLGTRFNWLCDSIDNDLKHALGDAPNSEFIIDPKGKIVVARQWSNAGVLRKDLAGMVGKVTPETHVADVGMKPLAPPKTAAKGVVPRVKLPDSMSAVKVEPLSKKDNEPFYVKLRAEGDQGLLRGDGKLYLGFFLDPLYKVHWNNKADPIVVEIESADGITISDQSLEGPTVEVAADADPREFLVDVAGRAGDTLTVSVFYFACDDAETFCKPVKQQYKVTLARDQDGGNRRSAGSRGGSRPSGGGGRPDADAVARMLLSLPAFQALDTNSDGQLSADEVNLATAALKRIDRNGDGKLSRGEWMPSQQSGNRSRRER